ncbi:carboxymuconolactone decarboxylase family protein [Streptomyces sp. NPDC002054]|uniref:carboxymuconolactone decarboxylase family protein n=1 Tax=Streptomyces sp. NPDC002054 TaxID=3154663 RepID=UPI0033313A88
MTKTAAPRMQDPTELLPGMAEVSASLFRAVGNRSVPRTTISLVHLRAGQIVGSTYLTVLHSSSLRKAGESEERITAVASWQDAPYFTEAERAALALVEAVWQPSSSGGERVPDELYARAAEHYDDTALATLVAAIGQIGFFIPFAVIGKPVPVSSLAHQQWS